MEALTGFFLSLLVCFTETRCEPYPVLPPYYTRADCEAEALAMSANDPSIKAYKCEEKKLHRS